jgi:hypothetical protein
MPLIPRCFFWWPRRLNKDRLIGEHMRSRRGILLGGCFELILLVGTLPLAARCTYGQAAPIPQDTITVSATAPTGYRVIKKYPVSGDGGWDYIALDSTARRLYVSHGTQVQVLDADSGKALGQIEGTVGVHGVALAPEFHHGFTSNGGDRSVTIFDLDTLKPVKKVQLGTGADFILYDPYSKRIFPLNEKTVVLDAQSGDIAGNIDFGGSTEAGVSDGKGTVYVNLADKNAIAVVDPKTLSVVKTYPIEFCTSPHSLSYDAVNQRLVIGCRGFFVAVNALTGKVVGGSLVCSGVDSSGFDPEAKLVFESCGEGVVSAIRQVTPDYYELVETIPTQLWAKTMVFDPVTKRIYLPYAEFELVLNSDPRKRPERKIKPGSFNVLVVGKH